VSSALKGLAKEESFLPKACVRVTSVVGGVPFSDEHNALQKLIGGFYWL
jgi:hypothetical protein